MIVVLIIIRRMLTDNNIWLMRRRRSRCKWRLMHVKLQTANSWTPADVSDHHVLDVSTRAWLCPHVQPDVTERRVFLVLRSPDGHWPELQPLESGSQLGRYGQCRVALTFVSSGKTHVQQDGKVSSFLLLLLFLFCLFDCLFVFLGVPA